MAILDALGVVGDMLRMDATALVTLLYVLAAFAALAAGAYWLRLVKARDKSERIGGAQSTRWLSEAATATAIAMFLAAGGYLVSLAI